VPEKIPEKTARFQFACSPDFAKRFMGAAGRLNYDQSELCRAALGLFLELVEKRPELAGLDLLVFIRDAKVTLFAQLEPNQAIAAQPIATPRAEAPRVSNTKGHKRH
jgi:hypothetical protein